MNKAEKINHFAAVVASIVNLARKFIRQIEGDRCEQWTDQQCIDYCADRFEDGTFQLAVLLDEQDRQAIRIHDDNPQPPAADDDEG